MKTAEILAGGARLVRTQPRAVAIWGLVYILLTAAMLAAMWPMVDGLVAFQQQIAAAKAGQAAPPGLPAGFLASILLGNAIMLVGLAVIFAAAVRAVARGGHDSWGFLRLGMDEVRLVGLGVQLVLIAIAATMVAVLAMIATVAALVIAFGQGAAIVALPLYLVFIAATVWAQVRISLAGAFTVLRGRIVIREAWRATAGRFWPLFGAYLVIGLAFLATGLLAGLVFNPAMFAAMAGTADPTLVEAALARQTAALFGACWLIWLAVGTILNVVLSAFAFGAVVTAALAVDRDLHGTAARD